MQTLGLSDSTPRTENRLKNIFWPSVQTATDVDSLGTQGYWICAVLAVFVFGSLTISGHPVIGVFLLLFYYLGGVGIREHSRYAAGVVLGLFVVDMLSSGPSVLKILIAALLLSNFRATWIASRWKPGADEAVAPPRFDETLGDKFADNLPMWLWPKARIPY